MTRRCSWSRLRRRAALGGLVALLATCSGCATLVNGGRHPIAFRSSPPGATVSTGDNAGFAEAGQTPVVVSMYPWGSAAGNGTVAVLRKEGYQDLVINLETGIHWSYWLNILFPPGFFFDYLLGSHLAYSEDAYEVSLTPR